MKVYQYIGILLLLLILDFLWIGVILKNPFSLMIKEVQKSDMEIKIIPAILAYVVLFLIAVIYLPKLNSSYEAFLLGFFIYLVYDLTNLATLKNWNYKIAIVDSLWGGFLYFLLYNFYIYTN